MSLLHLAAALKQGGNPPKQYPPMLPAVLDLSVDPAPEGVEASAHYSARISKAIADSQPILVGLNCFSSMHFPLVRQLAKSIRAGHPNLPVCLGGAHPTFFPREILQNCPEFDFVVIGEGEEQIVALADTIATGNFTSLKGIGALGFRDGETIVINPRSSYLGDLDRLPSPAYDLIHFPAYYTDHSNWHNPKQQDIKLSVPIYTTRSCPFSCNFCTAHSIMGRKLRRRDPAKVVDDIEMLVHDFGQNYFSFTDDNVNLDKQHFMAICKGIAQRKLDIQLCIPQGLYLNAVDEKLIGAFVEAGGVTVSVPIESGNSYIRNQIIGKNLTDETIYGVVNLLKKYNLFTVGLFIMGFAEDTPETLHDTLAMINRLGLDINGVSTLIPFPGTKVYEQASREKLLLVEIDDTKAWSGDTLLDPQNRQDFFVKPFRLEIDELRHFRKVFDDLYFTSERAQRMNLSACPN
jgi:radical SAM superfamily enzyme YgiQ (UPF0313 family)